MDPVSNDNPNNIKSQEDLGEILFLLNNTEYDTKVGMPFNTNILKICLNQKEEKLCIILARYYQI